MFCRLSVPCLVIFAVAGCGDRRYVPVSGVVTLDGKPLAGAEVRFQPIGGTLDKPAVGRGSYSPTDADGKFVLRVDGRANGAIVGKHRVTIAMPHNRPEVVPAKYNSATTLTFDVPPEGSDAANFDLKSK